MYQILWMMYQGFQRAFGCGAWPLRTLLCVPKWNYGPYVIRWGPKSNKMECRKFYKGCTKFCEECTKGSKVHSEVEIDP